MKKLIISLLALGALSTASFATFRDITTPKGAVDTNQNTQEIIVDGAAVPNAAYGNAGDELELGGSNRD